MYVHINIHGGRYRVTLDGVDVSADCFAASEERGFVCVYVRAQVDGTGPARLVTEWRHGRRRPVRVLRRGAVVVTHLPAARRYTPPQTRRPLAPRW